MSNIQLFHSQEFGQVRTIVKDGEPWFVAYDVATALEYSNKSRDVQNHCKRAELFKSTETVPRGVLIIPESDVYRLVMRSNLPKAVEFQGWVCDEVIPAIRKNGGYIMEHESDTDEDLLARAVLVANAQIAKREERIKALEAENKDMAPKAAFASEHMIAKGSKSLTEVSKLLKFKRKDLIACLERDKFIFRRGGNIEPYAAKVQQGLFETKAGTRNGHSYIQMYVTPKGMQAFANRYITELGE